MKPTLDVAWFGRKLRDARHARDATLHDVARLTGLSTCTISRVERGRQKSVRGDVLLTLAHWIGMDTQVLQLAMPGIDNATTTNLPDIIDAQVRADPRLTGQTASILSDLFRAVYDRLAIKP